MGRVAAAMMAMALVLTACGSDDDPQAAAEDTEPTTTTTEAPTDDPLAGSWTTEQTCEEQQAAIDRAAFTAEELELGDWQCVPEAVTLRFEGGGLVIFEDGDVAWDGAYEVGEDGTFRAGDTGDLYITYEYELDGDQLVVDMVTNDYPTASETELVGEKLAQTRIYESAPFTRSA